jgi:imidazolonepropionase-like amidohydrolase
MVASMSRALARLVLWLLAPALVGKPSSAQQPPRTFAFVDVTVIPMDHDGVLEHQTVVVADGRIATIGPVAAVRPPEGAAAIDGRGKFLMPGLGDAHAHLSTVGGGPALAERALALYALHGVTMIRSMYTEPHHREARERVERGELAGPRSVLVSPAFAGQTAPTPQAARDSIRGYREAGYRVAKILPGLSRETFDTVVAEAKRLGMPLAGHVPPNIGLQHALAAGFASLEHLDGMLEAMVSARDGPPSGFFGLGVLGAVDESRLGTVVEAIRRSGAVVVPTEFEMELFVSVDSGAAHARRSEMQFVPPALLTQWTRQKDNFARGAGITPERAARYRELRRTMIRALHEAGVPIALGSDAFNLFNVPGPGVADELAVYVEAGLTPRAALATATVQVARLLALPGVTGTVSVGSVADLVLLERNPLADVSHVRRLAGVMLRGAWIDRAGLERRLAALRTQ